MIKLTKFGPSFAGTPEDLERLRAQFSQTHYIRLGQLLDPALVDEVLHQLEQAEFETMVHGDIGTELCLQHNPAVYLLRFLANNYRLFQIIESVTGCSRIGCFAGRIYRVVPGLGHYDTWHDDLGDTRLVAMSINLSPKPYAGSILQLREGDSGQVHEVVNTGVGDAIIFRIGPQFRHRITEIRGDVAKTAFAGWFQSSPDFIGLLRELRKETISENNISRGTLTVKCPE